MKKIAQIITVLLCGLLFTTSCQTKEIWEKTGPEDDESLAGSIPFHVRYNILETEGTYDNTQLTDIKSDQSYVYTKKVSDTEISLDCQTTWGMTTFKIAIPKIPLSGVCHDVTFDYISDAISVTYNDKLYTSVNGTIKGWIRDPIFPNEVISKDIRIPFYDCEIDITCTIDGKALNLKITSINPDGIEEG